MAALVDQISSILALVVRVLGWVLGISLIGGIALVSLIIWSDGNKNQASNECTLRRMDSRIQEDITGLYHDTCMAAEGYRRRTTCAWTPQLASPPFCYAAKWTFWLD